MRIASIAVTCFMAHEYKMYEMPSCSTPKARRGAIVATSTWNASMNGRHTSAVRMLPNRMLLLPPPQCAAYDTT